MIILKDTCWRFPRFLTQPHSGENKNNNSEEDREKLSKFDKVREGALKLLLVLAFVIHLFIFLLTICEIERFDGTKFAPGMGVYEK